MLKENHIFRRKDSDMTVTEFIIQSYLQKNKTNDVTLVLMITMEFDKNGNRNFKH